MAIREVLIVGAKHETANEIGDFIFRGVQGEVPRVEDVNLGPGNVTAVRRGFRQVKR
jgi:hypothetical protein